MPFQHAAPNVSQMLQHFSSPSHVDGGTMLKHKLHDLGKQIQVLVAVFQGIEEEFELGRIVPRIDQKYSASHDPNSGAVKVNSALHLEPVQGNNAQASEDQQLPQSISAVANKTLLGSPFPSPRPVVKLDDWWWHMSMTSSFASSKMQGPEVELQDLGTFMDAINDNALEKVHKHLQLGADPNAAWPNVPVRGRNILSLTPLVASVLHDHADITHMLLKFKASVESKYSFAAGAQQHACTRCVGAACVSRGNLDMLMHP
jgi:hypothetical protein